MCLKFNKKIKKIKGNSTNFDLIKINFIKLPLYITFFIILVILLLQQQIYLAIKCYFFNNFSFNSFGLRFTLFLKVNRVSLLVA